MTIIRRQLLQISWRNVFRNKRRSFLTLLILALGCTGMILVGGFFENIMEGFRDAYIHSQTGHLQINAKGYYEKGTSAPFEYMIRDLAPAQQEIESNPMVLYTIPRLKFNGMASSGSTTISVLALGIDPVKEQKMGSHIITNSKNPSVKIVAGEDLSSTDPYGVVVGKGLLSALGLKIGDPINFLTTRETGAIDGAEFHVRGAFETILKDFDDRGMKMNILSAQNILGVPNQVHSLLVILDRTQNTNFAKSQIMDSFKKKNFRLEAITWEEQGEFYQKSKALSDKIYQTVQLIIAVIFFLSIANTINMALFERIREFGTMMAIGNSRGTIFSMIVLETAFLAFIGATLGLLVGCGIAKIISSFGILMPPPPQGTSPYMAMINLPAWLLLEVWIIASVSTLLASIIPGWRACHFRITQALGYV